MKNLSQNKNSGFTLIEAMVSIGLFSVIMIIGITAVLSVNNTYRKSRTMRSAIDNLSFVMEDMARNIRLGFDYRCIESENILYGEVEDPLDGIDCKGILFEPYWNPVQSDPDDQVGYLIDGDSIFKTTNGGQSIDDSNPAFLPMNSIDVRIDPVTSGFTIYGTDPLDGEQPSVLIRINGTAQSGKNSTNFNLQTTVSQRLLDAPPV